MRKYLLIVIFTLFGISGEIEWRSDLDRAINLAKKEGKNIFLFVSSKFCPYCRKMEREIFNDKEGANYLSGKYIFVKMNISDAREIFRGTSATPTIYIFTPKKELLASQVGYQNEEFFYWTVGKADRKLEELKREKN